MAILARPQIIRYLQECETVIKEAVSHYLPPEAWRISWCEPRHYSLVYLPYSKLWSREHFINMEASL